MSLRVDIICNDGSPLGVSELSIFGEDGRMGVGGAELMLLTLCRGWHDAGHTVRLYNSPKFADRNSVFKQLPIDAFTPSDERDVVIIFRSPNYRLTDATKGLKIWLSTDQTTVGDFKAFSSKVDKIVTISPHHAKHFQIHYGITDTITIDIPIRIWEYEEHEPVEKVPYRCLFNHIPDRGVIQLRTAWAEIVRDFPKAHLVITSDWRLWAEWQTVDALIQYKNLYRKLPNVSYMGAVNRKDLIKLQLESQLNLYPSVYEELFCISVAENSVAGCYPITSDIGALSTTNMGTVIKGSSLTPEFNRKFIDTTLEFLNNQDMLQSKSDELMKKAKERFSLERILREWDEKVFK